VLHKVQLKLTRFPVSSVVAVLVVKKAMLTSIVACVLAMLTCSLACASHQLSLQKKLDQLPAVDIQHAPTKLPYKLCMFAYVDFLAQSLCSVHSDCAFKLG